MPSLQPFSNTSIAHGSSLHSIKTQSKAKEEEEKIKQKRKRGVIMMMLQFMQEHGYARSLESLQMESSTTLQKYTPADNLDMCTIFTEYEDYYEFRFGRRPKFFRNTEAGDAPAGSTIDFGGEGVMTRPSKAKKSKTSAASSDKPPTPPTLGGGGGGGGSTKPSSSARPPPASADSSKQQSGSFFPPLKATSAFSNHSNDTSKKQNDANGDASGMDLGATGTSIPPSKMNQYDRSGAHHAPPPEEEEVFQGRPLKPLPRFETQELQELASGICRDILDQNPTVTWNSIAELDSAKQLLKEAVVMPVKYPELFAGIVRPWKGILLFGPPGTGKTMLAKAVATECRTTFFNISASSVVSKWRGDSEKIVRMLFELAVHFSPSTIFIDELDSLMSARTNDGSEHEGSRRMKTELLIQMDGLSKRKGGDVVFVLAASNVPWDLDAAMLRRMEKRIHVGLPSSVARAQMFERCITNPADDIDYEDIARRTEGYSGADIDIICREATMRPIRILIEKLEKEKNLDHKPLQKPRVSTEDVLASIRSTQSSCGMVDLKKYDVWEKKFGSTMS